MANTTISPNMNLIVPTVGTDPGPDWANNLNADLSIIDSHNHSLGQGVQITPAGININADLPINNNNITMPRSVRFNPQSSTLSGASDIGCLYESGVDLYYNDGSGNQVRITQSGSVTGSTGTITGLPSGTASASYSAGTFTFQKATSTPATMNVGSMIVGQEVASGNGVTIAASGSQVSNYGITLPIALPSAIGSVQMDTSGNLSILPIGSTIQSGSIGEGVSVGQSAFTPLGSLTITAGTWLMIGCTTYSGNGGNDYYIHNLNTISGSSSGTVIGQNAALGAVYKIGGIGSAATLNFTTTVVTNTTYYLNCETNAASAGTSGIIGSIIALRIG